jgi:Domain of unknown function (DUF4397)
MRRSPLVFLASLLVSCGLVVGCGGDGSKNSLTNPDKPSITAVNASPDSAALDFRMGDNLVGSALGYLQTGTLVTQDADDYDTTIRPTAGGIDADDQVLTTVDGRDYILLALGLTDYADEPIKRLRLSPFEFDRTIPNGNKARLIVVNAFIREPGFETPPIDFQDGDVPQFQLGNIAFGAHQTILVDAGTINFEARRTGSELVYATKSQTFESGKIYLALVTGIENGTGTQVPQIAYLPLTPKS